MKKHLHYIKTETIRSNGKTVVNETAKVDLNEIRAFKVVRAIPMMDLALNTFDIYNNGQLILQGTGVSRCHPDDEYNEKLGYYIAQSRAQAAIFKQYKDFMDFVIKTLDKYFYNDITELWAEVANTHYAINDHIEFDLTNDEAPCNI